MNTSLMIEPYITAEKVQSRVTELGQELQKHFGNERIMAICVLKGSFIFYSDLIRAMSNEVVCEFIGVHSYNGTQSSGEVKVTLDLSLPIEGQRVLLVEDIVDTGLTMNFLKSTLQLRNPKSITTVSLLHKPEALKVPCQMDYIGFEIRNEFVVGYGLDYEGYYRNLPYIGVVKNFQ